MSSITIITPTYNRAGLLPRLYQSLCSQTNGDFEWLVIDDGSQDDTEELIGKYCRENVIKIDYERQENAGKHTALNRGITRIRSELTFIVDSDDYLPEDAVAIILSYHRKYRDTKGLCGYSFLRCHGDGSVNTAYFPKDELIATYLEARINGNIGGDKAEVFYTDILKQYPFPVFEGEKYMPEDAVWMQMSGPYKMVHINQNVYFCDYLEGGLTQTGRKMKIYSPRGMTLRSRIYLQNKDTCLKVKIKMMMLYIIYGHFAKYDDRKLYKEIGNKVLWYLLYIPSDLIYRMWKRKLSAN
ncbi:MAG: glycosyltransferase family 2 protein [Eubacterium sp.]|nr:glycosyltransferase family 2 protein [Eubacterium sp.]